jgi:lysophospholipase L1-like esterase
MKATLQSVLLLWAVLFAALPWAAAQTPANDTIFVDFGNNISPAPWNNLADPVAGTIPNLLNGRGLMTDAGLTVYDPFNNLNTSGSTTPDPAIGFPVTATADSFFGNVGDFGGQSQPTGGVDLTGLDPQQSYTFTIFAARAGVNDNREAQYVLEGATTDTVYLDASSNNDRVATVSLSPDADGRIRLTASPGPNNDNGTRFYYLGAFYMVYDFEDIAPPTPENLDTLLIDFGNNLSPAPWNNITDPVAGQIEDLVGLGGVPSGVSIAVFDPFNNINTAGSTMPNPAIGFPVTATADSFFGNVADFGGQSQPTGGVELTNMNPATEYTFTIFASRVATDNREAQYVLEGATTDTIYLDAASNNDSLASVALFPDADGRIRLTASPGPNNNNASQFYYLGAMKVSYQRAPVVLPLDTVLVDFGNNLSPAPWNNVADPVAGEIATLSNENGLLTGYGIRVFDPFNNINTAGTVTPNPAIGFPATATADSFFGNVTEFGGQTQPTGGVELYNLNTEKEYELVIFASRAATDNRETQYLLEGLTTDTIYLNTASNSDSVAIARILPAADGSIRITASPGPNNNNPSGFYYLGALKLIYDEEEPVGETVLNLTAPVGGEYWQVGKTPAIRWESRNVPGDVTLEYSTDNGNAWTSIATVPAATQAYTWAVPNTPSTECLVRVASETLSSQSPATFEIADDTTVCRIVVLGSSTAAGTGPSSPDSTWVNRLRASLQSNTRYEVVNLARGGYTTYHILPTGTNIPQGVSISVDTARNITKALTFSPFAILVNMPSNDATNNFSVRTQLENFAAVVQTAENRNVPVWITTTQPRNFTTFSQIQLLQDARDSILSIYGERAIDFWNGIAEEDGWILPAYNSGDGIHLNSAAHRILFERVAAIGLETYECSVITATDEPWIAKATPAIAFPNPTDNELFVEIEAAAAGDMDIHLMDMFGRVLHTQQESILAAGTQRFRSDYTLRQAGVQYLFCIVTLRYNDGRTERITLPVVVK